MSEEQSQHDLSTGIDFIRFMMPNVQKEWEEIERKVRKLPGFPEIPGFLKEIADSTLNYRELENGF
jgi:hypothetical protein